MGDRPGNYPVKRVLVALEVAIELTIGGSGLIVGGAAVADEQPPAVSLAFAVQPLLDTYCVQCHLLESAQAGLVLEQGEAWKNLVNIDSTQASLPRVRPGIPEASYLLHKLRGTHIEVGGSGQMMPYGGGDGIGATSIELIQRWISEGAADN